MITHSWRPVFGLLGLTVFCGAVASAQRSDTASTAASAAASTTASAPRRAGGDTLASVVITSTRGTRRLADEPERVEVLPGEDVDEKTVMHPGNLTTLLSEMPGVRVQTIAPALGGAGLRVQGLRSRYTLLLADGLPLYGSTPNGLGLAQIPPIDLAQAEVIKGAATALYGPAAAGGVLNLISRRPPPAGAREREILLNRASRHGSDALLWSADRLSERLGYTFVGGGHRQAGTDVNGDGWSDVPELRRGEVRPRLFWTGAGGNSAVMTAGGVDERRSSGTLGGSAPPSDAAFPVTAATRRADAGVVANFVDSRGVLTVRMSADREWQHRRFGDSLESDRRGAAFAEATISGVAGNHQLVLGSAMESDALTSVGLPEAAYAFRTASVFAQDTYDAGERVSLSTTVRADRQSRYGTFLSPRASALVRLASGWTARASAGSGVFAPTSVVDDAEGVGLARVRGFRGVGAERMRSASLDLTRVLGPLEINGTLFHSAIAHAVVAREATAAEPGTITIINAPSPTRTRGAELFATYDREPLAVTALYSYTRSTEWSPDEARRVDVPLTPRHAAGLDVALGDDDGGTRVALELFYTGRQALRDDPYRTVGVPYTLVGAIAEQRVGPATIFLNAENLTDVRQAHFDRLLLPHPSPAGRRTTDAWAPLEGRTLNGGVRVRF